MEAICPDGRPRPYGAAGGRVLLLEPQTLERDFGRRSFTLRHTLAASALLSPARLAQAAERALASKRTARNFHVAGGDAAKDSRFADMGRRSKRPEALADPAAHQAWTKLSSINEFDDDFADLLRDALQDLRDASDSFRRQEIRFAACTVFAAAPNVITPYHIDHDFNFLLQITGNTKTVCLFPPDDRELVPCTEIEDFYVSNSNAARFRPALEDRGVAYPLPPGLAVHHPPLAPHWVRNGLASARLWRSPGSM